MSVSKLDRLLLQVDAEVLKLYALPEDLEGRVLGMFNEWKRVGVSFSQARYLPKLLEGIHLFEFLQFEESWSATNRERGKLIDKNVSGNINEHERARLGLLQAYADYHVQKVAPRPTFLLDDLEKRILGSPEKARGR